MRPENHAHRFEEILKPKLQASAASGAKTLRSQNRQRAKIRFSLNGFRVVHGRLISDSSSADFNFILISGTVLPLQFERLFNPQHSRCALFLTLI